MATAAGKQGPSADVESSVVARVSREVVQLHSRYYGRGPTRARAIWKGDILVVVLEGIFTKAEETLVAAGHFDQVRAHRQTFHDEVDALFRGVVEAASGRAVDGFLSQVDREGVACEVFLLGSGPAAARDERAGGSPDGG